MTKIERLKVLNEKKAQVKKLLLALLILSIYESDKNVDAKPSVKKGFSVSVIYGKRYRWEKSKYMLQASCLNEVANPKKLAPDNFDSYIFSGCLLLIKKKFGPLEKLGIEDMGLKNGPVTTEQVEWAKNVLDNDEIDFSSVNRIDKTCYEINFMAPIPVTVSQYLWFNNVEEAKTYQTDFIESAKENNFLIYKNQIDFRSIKVKASDCKISTIKVDSENA